jgi:hypothetical protein
MVRTVKSLAGNLKGLVFMAFMMFLLSGLAKADTLGIGDSIKIVYGPGSLGGEYDIFNALYPSSELFVSFCADSGKYVDDTGVYQINSITEVFGGAAYLYSHFRAGNLSSGYTSTIEYADDLQNAIYSFLGMTFVSDPQTLLYINEANGKSADNVVVLGFTPLTTTPPTWPSNIPQPIFALTSDIPVPEPSSSLLIGTGLIAIASISRRKK